MILPTKTVDLPRDCDFLFKPATQANLVLFAHLVDHTMTGVLCRNESGMPVRVPRKLKLGVVQEMDYENCFQAEIDVDFAMTRPKSDTANDLRLKSENESSSSTSISEMETQLPNGVMIYGNTHAT